MLFHKLIIKYQNHKHKLTLKHINHHKKLILIIINFKLMNLNKILKFNKILLDQIIKLNLIQNLVHFKNYNNNIKFKKNKLFNQLIFLHLKILKLKINFKKYLIE